MIFLLNSFNILKIFDKGVFNIYSQTEKKINLCQLYEHLKENIKKLLHTLYPLLNIRTTLHIYKINNSSQKQNMVILMIFKIFFNTH